MSDNFIPFNQSTPLQGGSQSFYYNNASMTPKRNRNKGVKKPKRPHTYDDCKRSIEDYLHPSMLQDPWYRLRKNQTV